jgi:biopolymer transport protein ExbB/TolQ
VDPRDPLSGARHPVDLPARFAPGDSAQDARVVLETTAPVPAAWRGRPLTLAIALFPGPATLDVDGQRMTSQDRGLAHAWRIDSRETAGERISLRLALDCRATPWLTVVPRLSATEAGDPAYASIVAVNIYLAIAGTALGAAVALLYLTLFLFDRRRSENGWVAAQGALGAPTVVACSLRVPDSLLRSLAAILVVLVFTIMLSAIGAITSYFRRTSPSRGWFAVVVLAIVVGSTLAYRDKQAAVLLLLVMVAPMEVRAFAMLLDEYRTGRDRLAAMALAVGWLVLMLTQLPNFLLFMGRPAVAGGLLTAGLGFTFYYVLQVVVLARDHTRSLRETEARAKELEARSREVGLLNAELRHQIAERSRELTEALSRSGPSVPPAELAAGETFDRRYRVERPLGRGGMGAVYEVERLADGRRLALKVVTTELSGRSAARFAQEAEIGARLQHENLVSIVDVGVAAGGTPFLVMELVLGTSMEEQRRRFGDERWATPILRQIAAGLAELHAHRIVHRDLKPANVLLVEGGEGTAPLAKVSDFGISRFGIVEDGLNVDVAGATLDVVGASPRDLTQTGAVMGTPLYMAPEAWLTPARHPSADVFSFGIVAYEALTGRAPFAVPPVLLVRAGQTIPEPLPIAAAPTSFGALILSCLHLEPTKRPRAKEIAAWMA